MQTTKRLKNIIPSRLSPLPENKVSPGFFESDGINLRTLKTTAIVDLLEDQIKRRDALLDGKLKTRLK